MKRVVLLIATAIFAIPSAYATITSSDGTGTQIKVKPKTHEDLNTDAKPLGDLTDSEPTDPAKKAFSIDNFSATAALTTNYVFRGITQTENAPAAQAGVTYTFPIGLYFNLWGSNVKFSDLDAAASIEVDKVVGIHNDIGENFTYDINYARYNYPYANSLNYNEANSVFNWRFLQLGVSYSGNVYNSGSAGTYVNGGLNWDIPCRFVMGMEGMNLLALVGHYSLPTAAGNTYNDINLALSKTVKNYTLALQWTNTNHKNPPYDGAYLLGTLTANI